MMFLLELATNAARDAALAAKRAERVLKTAMSRAHGAPGAQEAPGAHGAPGAQVWHVLDDDDEAAQARAYPQRQRTPRTNLLYGAWHQQYTDLPDAMDEFDDV